MGNKNNREKDSEVKGLKKNNKVGTSNNQTIDFSQVIANLPTAVIVTDKSGYPVSYNQSVVDILGYTPFRIPPEEWPQRYGLYLEENKTYYPDKNLPLSRALNGEEVNAEDIFLSDYRNSDGCPPNLL
jgi:PAS domain-containing protein